MVLDGVLIWRILDSLEMTTPSPRGNFHLKKLESDHADIVGSPKHWDNECKYSRQGDRVSRANLAVYTERDFEAQEEYEDIYLDF